jgi:hypothetical protein
VFPCLAAYFAWKRRVTSAVAAALLVPFAVLAVALNLYPIASGGSTALRRTAHPDHPVAASLSGLRRREVAVRKRRMDFVRHTGEVAIYHQRFHAPDHCHAAGPSGRACYRGGIVFIDRNLLILMDTILVLVLCLLLYSISARDPLAKCMTLSLQIAQNVVGYLIAVIRSGAFAAGLRSRIRAAAMPSIQMSFASAVPCGLGRIPSSKVMSGVLR